MVILLAGPGDKFPVHVAVRQRNMDRLNELLEWQDVNQQNYRGQTAVHVAAMYNWSEGINLLVSKGADISTSDRNGKTALHLAAESGAAQSVQTLIDQGIELESRDMAGMTALHLAAKTGRLQIVQSLVAAGAEIDAVHNRYQTPLHMAAASGYREICVVLLNAGANVLAEDADGHTALDKALQSRSMSVAKLLDEHRQAELRRRRIAVIEPDVKDAEPVILRPEPVVVHSETADPVILPAVDVNATELDVCSENPAFNTDAEPTPPAVCLSLAAAPLAESAAKPRLSTPDGSAATDSQPTVLVQVLRALTLMDLGRGEQEAPFEAAIVVHTQDEGDMFTRQFQQLLESAGLAPVHVPDEPAEVIVLPGIDPLVYDVPGEYFIVALGRAAFERIAAVTACDALSERADLVSARQRMQATSNDLAGSAFVDLKKLIPALAEFMKTPNAQPAARLVAGNDAESSASGSSHDTPAEQMKIVVGGLYSVTSQDQYRIYKILAREDGVVHFRLYANRFDQRPEDVEPDNLTMGDPSAAGGFGLAHVPMDEQAFLRRDPQLIKKVNLTAVELESYWKWRDEHKSNKTTSEDEPGL